MATKPSETSADYFSGFDLGQASDFSALVTTERQERPGLAALRAAWLADKRKDKPPLRSWLYTVRYMRVWDLGTKYTEIADDAKLLFGRKPLTGSVLAADYTGVGRPVVDMLREKRVPAALRAVTITGGNAWKLDEATGEYHIPKRDLVSNLLALMELELIKVSACADPRRSAADRAKDPAALSDRLKKELQLFTVKQNRKTGHEQFEAWSDSQHDDMVLGLAMAVWMGERGSGRAADLTVQPAEQSAVHQAPLGVFAEGGAW